MTKGQKIITISVGVLVVIIVAVAVIGSNEPQTNTSKPAQTQKVSDVQSKESTNTTTKQSEEGDLFKVIKVVDGDTLSVDIAGKATTLRLIGINTPETVDPRKPVECFGKEASAKAHTLLDGKRVRLEYDKSQGVLDKYGRTLAYVFLEDGLFFNKYMIAEGYAYEYTYNLPYKYQAEFKQAQKDAEAGDKGLWAPGVCEMAPAPTQTAPATTQSSPAPTTQPAPTPTEGNYICSYDAYNCPNFSTHDEAQAVFEACGGPTNDIHGLDKDKDGLACEGLP